MVDVLGKSKTDGVGGGASALSALRGLVTAGGVNPSSGEDGEASNGTAFERLLKQYYQMAQPPVSVQKQNAKLGGATVNANANAHLASALLLVPQDEVSGTFLARVINAGDSDLLKFLLANHSRARCCGVKSPDDPSGLPQVHPGDLPVVVGPNGERIQCKYEKGQWHKWRGSNKPRWTWVEKG